MSDEIDEIVLNDSEQKWRPVTCWADLATGESGDIAWEKEYLREAEGRYHYDCRVRNTQGVFARGEGL